MYRAYLRSPFHDSPLLISSVLVCCIAFFSFLLVYCIGLFYFCLFYRSLVYVSFLTRRAYLSSPFNNSPSLFRTCIVFMCSWQSRLLASSCAPRLSTYGVLRSVLQCVRSCCSVARLDFPRRYVLIHVHLHTCINIPSPHVHFFFCCFCMSVSTLCMLKLST